MTRHPSPETLAEVLNRGLNWCGNVFGTNSSEPLKDFVNIVSKENKLIVESKLNSSKRVFDTPEMSKIFSEIETCVYNYIPVYLGSMDVENIEFCEGPWYSVMISAVLFMNESDSHRKIRTAKIRIMNDGSIDLILDSREIAREVYY